MCIDWHHEFGVDGSDRHLSHSNECRFDRDVHRIDSINVNLDSEDIELIRVCTDPYQTNACLLLDGYMQRMTIKIRNESIYARCVSTWSYLWTWMNLLCKMGAIWHQADACSNNVSSDSEWISIDLLWSCVDSGTCISRIGVCRINDRCGWRSMMLVINDVDDRWC